MVRATLLAGTIIATLGTSLAVACSCAAQTDVEYRLQADVVFAGTVTAIADPNAGTSFSIADPITWTFAVERTAKGTSQQNQQVRSARDGAGCGMFFTLGRRYVVYADRTDGTLHTSICSGTRELAPGEPPFAFRRVAVYGFTGSQPRRAIGVARIGEYPAPAALRLLLTARFHRKHSITSEIPPGTRLVAYSTDGRTARVTLSRRFATLTGRDLRRAVVQVVLTVGAIPGVSRVRVVTEIGSIAGFGRALSVSEVATLI